jgi:DNA mismatch repair ATPase MutL
MPKGNKKMKNLYQYRAERVASRYMEARLFGLLSNHIGWQDLRRFEKQLQWMFKKGQHKVTSDLNRKGDNVIKIEAQDTKISISGFTSSGSGYDYKKLAVEVNGRLVKKTDDLKEATKVVYKTLLDLGLRP